MHQLPFPCPAQRWNCYEVATCDSTNTQAAKLLHQVSHVFLRADHQSAGRGQRGTVWSDQPGQSLLCSLGIRGLAMPTEHTFYITMQISLAVRALIAQRLPEQQVRIKWPNDILVNGDKVAGILIENQLRGRTVQQSIIGVGINLNQQQLPYPSAISLRLVSGQTYLPQEAAAALRKQLAQVSADPETLRQQYLNSLLAYQEWYLFRRNANQKDFIAKVSGVDTWGRLCLEHPDKREERVEMKAVTWLRPLA